MNIESAARFEQLGSSGSSSEKQAGIDEVSKLKEVTETILGYGKGIPKN